MYMVRTLLQILLYEKKLQKTLWDGKGMHDGDTGRSKKLEQKSGVVSYSVRVYKTGIS